MKKFKRFLIAISFSYTYLIMVLAIPTDMSAILEGSLQDTRDIIAVDGYEVHNMHTIYVLNYAPLSYFQSSLISFVDSTEVYPISEYEKSLTALQMYQVGQIQKESSYHTALLVALEKSNMTYSYVFKGFALTSIPNKDVPLKIGDLIIEINGISLTPYMTLTEFYTAQTLEITLIRDNEVIEVVYTRQALDIPLYVYPMYWISQTEVDVQLLGLDNVVGGPSSGLIMALSLYATLHRIPNTFTIAGTGTIGLDGKVGAIGGLNQKYEQTIDHVDYMLIPYSQRLSLENYNSEKVVFVRTIDEAIDFLRGLYEMD